MKRNIYIFLLVSFLMSNLSFAQDMSTFLNKADAFFKAHVANGKVAYSKIHANPNALHELVSIAEGLSVSKEDAKTYQAFWINAYNISVIKGIVDNYPIKSPLDKAGFFDKTKYNVGGKKITLNDIENKLLRSAFKDARFHFVLVCGALGCPPLISKAYLPDTLDAQLEAQTIKALNGSFLKVDAKKKRVSGSEILKWYKEDFVREGSEIDFINQYRKEQIPSNYKLNYFTYNWNLNKQ